MNVALICLLGCIPTILTSSPTTPSYTAEIHSYTQSLAPNYIFYPGTASEKMFRDIFSFATMPYTQPINLLSQAQCPLLHTLIDGLSEQYDIQAPLLFLAQDNTTPHIDIKLCVFNTTSAILIHPATITTLTPRVFERYIEQAFMRIKTSIHTYQNYLSTQKKKNGIYAAITGTLLTCAGALLTYFNKNAQHRWINSTAIAALATGYGALLYHLLKKKYAGFSFQRISSFHNTEQAREDYFPPLDSNQQPTFTQNPTELFGIEAIIQTQDYLRSRNAQFCELEKLDLEKNEESSKEDSYYQQLELLRQKINQPHLKRKKSNKSAK